MAKLITLMTDFGLKDGNVAVMKGVIWNIAPQAQITDLSHLIQPQNIREAAFILARSSLFFPEETIHVVVVDPGVGTARLPIAVKIGSQYYVCPDNGILTLLVQHAEENHLGIQSVALDKQQFWLPQVSHVFHGRDIFAPVAAHLANGVDLKELGSPIENLVSISFPHPRIGDDSIIGEVIFIDSFGNICTNILENHMVNRPGIVVKIGEIEIKGIVNTFGERSPGELIALFGSTHNLGISMVNGNAAMKIGAMIGQSVQLLFP